MARIREIEMTIGSGTIGTIVSNLNVDFDITRTNTKQANAAKFNVYNVKADTKERIMTEGNSVIFKAGYQDEGNLGIIYSGTITNIEEKGNPPTYNLEITCSDLNTNREALVYSTVSFSYKAKTTLASILADVAGQIGIPISGLSNVKVILNNGFVFAGSFINLFKRLDKILLANNLYLYVDSGEMVIFSRGKKDDRFGSAYITPRTGLIGEVQEVENKKEQDTKKRIKFDYFVNPKISPNAVVILKSEKVSGTFIVDVVRFFGNNYGGDFRSQIQASTSFATEDNKDVPVITPPLFNLRGEL